MRVKRTHTTLVRTIALIQPMYSNLAVWGEQTVILQLRYHNYCGPDLAHILHGMMALGRSTPVLPDPSHKQAIAWPDVSNHSKLCVGQVKVYGTVLLSVKRSCCDVVTYYIPNNNVLLPVPCRNQPPIVSPGRQDERVTLVTAKC